MAKGPKPSPGGAELLGRATLLLALVLAPALEVRWDVRSPASFREVVETLGVLRWPDILTGMFLNNSPFAISAGVVLSFVIADSAMRRAVDQFVETKGKSSVIEADFAEIGGPLAVVVLLWVMHGRWSALICGAAVILTRLGRTRELFAPGREAVIGASFPVSRSQQRVSAISDFVAAAAFLSLPFYAFGAATDGKAWAPVLECRVASTQETGGASPSRVRAIELDRDGTGVVGWRLDNGEVIEGRDCLASADDRVRNAYK